MISSLRPVVRRRYCSPFLACLNPGDEIIVPEPAYANYMAFAISAGAKIRTIATTIEEGFSLPKVEKFEELITERTRAILDLQPNNPTGYLYTRREMNQIRGTPGRSTTSISF